MKPQTMVPEPSAEPSIDDLLNDPIVRAVMAADGVEPEELRALLRSVAERLQRHDLKRNG